ncbi:sensor histidine kinase [Nocardia otitidiscaviarum]|uniref:histidine kinase n=1 Tax=Nocardia otitidiscaviarum TaxID=1823 RepID=A0A516NI04_9NOCA|nr:sensor histidine kinase [Nocardia otitidiscaviarum]MBF6177334.1 sensor histidine kinase [Nocardia otitidiscaviarum]MCP9619978.1 sensor histidine kinase [Nocardia otitidiscaviarum]QDP78547.1 sensor histidine kinase [Nocardia otitidiscaviarum]
MDGDSAPTRGFRGPFRRWPRTADAVLAAVLFVLAVHVADGPGDTLVLRPMSSVPVVVLVLFAVASAALYLRRRHPLPVLGAALLAWAVTVGSGYSGLGGIAIVALYSVGRYARDGRWSYLGAAGAIALVILDGALDGFAFGDIFAGVVVMELAWYIGRRIRLRGQRAEQARRERAAAHLRVLTEERTRIARELHDVVAHRVSMMTVQAGAAKAVAAVDPEAARQAMAAVEEAGREALDELRHLLGVLRPDVDNDDLGPQPGLADLPRLIDQVRRAGLDVTADIDEFRTPLAARVELSAFRIVQEALTNVLKHSGPGTHADIRLRAANSGGEITLEVLDDGRGAAARTDAAVPGHGIVGMRERALLLGGSLDAKPRPGGGFRVAARLPTGADTHRSATSKDPA